MMNVIKMKTSTSIARQYLCFVNSELSYSCGFRALLFLSLWALADVRKTYFLSSLPAYSNFRFHPLSNSIISVTSCELFQFFERISNFT